MGIQICSNKGAWSPGCATRGKKGANLAKILKQFLLENYKLQSFDISYEASLGHGDSSLFIS